MGNRCKRQTLIIHLYEASRSLTRHSSPVAKFMTPYMTSLPTKSSDESNDSMIADRFWMRTELHVSIKFSSVLYSVLTAVRLGISAGTEPWSAAWRASFVRYRSTTCCWFVAANASHSFTKSASGRNRVTWSSMAPTRLTRPFLLWKQRRQNGVKVISTIISIYNSDSRV